MARQGRSRRPVPDQAACKARLRELIELAQAIRGWSAKEVAAALDRDVHNLVPQSGLPKIDVVKHLADALEWPVQDVLDDLWCVVPREPPPAAQEDWATLDRMAYAAHQAGRFDELVEIARRGFAAARTGDQRARACCREYLGHDGCGQYTLALAAVQRGMRETNRDRETTSELRLALANCHYVLGNVHEAVAVSAELAVDIVAGDSGTRSYASMLGFAEYVKGHALRVIAGGDPDLRGRNADRGLTALAAAVEHLTAASALVDASPFAWFAETCRGGMLELEVLLGRRSPERALETVLDRLDGVVDTDGIDAHQLESMGWWCIFGANVALRHVAAPDRAEQLLGIFTNKADEIAERLGNWALRERVWTLELGRRRTIEMSTGEPIDWVLGRTEARALSGTMSRFPVFRETGWQILRASRIVGDA